MKMVIPLNRQVHSANRRLFSSAEEVLLTDSSYYLVNPPFIRAITRSKYTGPSKKAGDNIGPLHVTP